MRSVTFQEYCKKVQEVSFRFQYLEETLKVYLGMCFEIVDLSLGGRLCFGRYGRIELARLQGRGFLHVGLL